MWQHLKLSDVSLRARSRYSLVVDEDVKKPNKPKPNIGLLSSAVLIHFTTIKQVILFRTSQYIGLSLLGVHYTLKIITIKFINLIFSMFYSYHRRTRIVEKSSSKRSFSGNLIPVAKH